MFRSRIAASLGTIALACLCAAPTCGGSDSPDTNDGGGADGGGAASDQEGVSVPASLSGMNAKSTLSIKLTFASKTDYDATKFLAVLFVKAGDPAAECGKVWSKALDLQDASRLNIIPYPLTGSTITYEPGEGDQSVFVYTFTNLPAAVCLNETECATPSAQRPFAAADDGGDTDAAGSTSADAGAPTTCVASGAGLGICRPTAQTLPTSGGCSVTTITNQGSATTEVSLTERPN
jgi:hypothetical protein